MPLLISNILFAVLSVALYVHAPEGYSHHFCQSVMLIYILHNVCWMVFNGGKRLLRFELFFMISFLFCNFIYPVFYAEVYPHWLFYMREFNRHIINQATAMAYMAYAFYLLGISDMPWQNRKEPTQPTVPIRHTYLLILCLIAVAGFGLFVITGGYAALANVYSGGGDLREVGVFSYFNNIFTIATLLLATFVFRVEGKLRWLYLAILCTFILLLLSTGSRQLSISIVLILVVTFSLHVYRLRGWQLAILLPLGVLALFGVMLVRKSGLNTEDWASYVASAQTVSILDIFEDLTINSINLYVLVEWGNTHDLSWLHGVLMDLASPIPKLSGWIVDYYNEPIEWLNGGDLPSYILLGGCAGWGTGTNMVGELFRSFGAVGMCCFMFGLGLLLKEAYYRANTSAYWYAFYMLMVGHAIIYPRGPFLYDPRTIVWGLALLWLIIHGVERYYRVFRKEGTA